MPQSLWSVRRFITLEGALSSPLEQARTSTGSPCRNMGSSFHNRNSSQEESTSCRWQSCVPCSKTARKGMVFPVEIIYTRFLCNCHWEQCSLHGVPAAVFCGDPFPKLGDLTSQGEDDRALCTKPAIFQGVKKNLIALFTCPCQPGMSHLLANCLR